MGLCRRYAAASQGAAVKTCRHSDSGSSGARPGRQPERGGGAFCCPDTADNIHPKVRSGPDGISPARAARRYARTEVKMQVIDELQ